MLMIRRSGVRSGVAVVLLALLASVLPAQDRKVSVYVSVDIEHAEQILKAFEQKTGIKVAKTDDTEANKTVGLVQRIIAEKGAARADVFWNNECGQTLRLKEMGLLDAYVSPAAADIPAEFKDPEGFWTGFGARARVIAYNTKLITEDQVPKRIRDLADARFKGKGVMSKPLVGTALTHACVLYARDGKDKTDAWFESLLGNDLHFTPGNGPAMREVAEGGRPYCLTDTDDAWGAAQQKYPVNVIYPDQGADDPGAVLIPNSVMLIKGAEHPAEAKAFIDYLLSPDVEATLAKGLSAQIPVRPSVPRPPNVKALSEIKRMPIDWAVVGRMIDNQAPLLNKKFDAAPSSSQPGGGEAKSRTATWILAAVLGLAIVLVIVRAVAQKRGGESA
jgi:iron(III) transport system substrate-binding protein